MNSLFCLCRHFVVCLHTWCIFLTCTMITTPLASHVKVSASQFPLSGSFCRMIHRSREELVLTVLLGGSLVSACSAAGIGVLWTGKTLRWSWRVNSMDRFWSETVLTPGTSWAWASGRRESHTTRAWSTIEVRNTQSCSVSINLLHKPQSSCLGLD